MKYLRTKGTFVLQLQVYNRTTFDEEALLHYAIPLKKNGFGELRKNKCERYNVTHVPVDELISGSMHGVQCLINTL